MRNSLVAVLISLELVGCATSGSIPKVTLNTRTGYSQKVSDVIVGIKTDGIPATFTIPFVSNLRVLFAQHQVNADVHAISELDLDPLTQAQIRKFSFSMFCIPTKTFSNQYALQSITMNCTLTEIQKNIVVMKADVIAQKGWGFGFGQNEAEHATQELIKQMEQAGLISAQQGTL